MNRNMNMKILVTGAKGFVGKNLCTSLQKIIDNNDIMESTFKVSEIFQYDIDTNPILLDDYCKQTDFVFNLAGVTRPNKSSEFMAVNFGFASVLLDTLKKYDNTCPVMLASSVQATLEGRFAGSDYGKSKLAGEELFFDYSEETGAKVLVYRFPNLFGRWSRPNYNSVVATFCNNYANDIPIKVNDPSVKMELLYIDDLIEEMLFALTGNEHRCEYDGVNAVESAEGRYCFSPVTVKLTLGEIVDILDMFKQDPKGWERIETSNKDFIKKLYSTYLSYMPD